MKPNLQISAAMFLDQTCRRFVVSYQPYADVVDEVIKHVLQFQ